jgi:hypothetical protein
VAGLVLTGRLVKVVEPETYTRKDGTDRTTYPALVVLTGDETVKVEYREVEARDDALLAAGFAGEVEPDGMVPTLPLVMVPVRALGAWDADTRTFGAVRLSGV